MNALNIPKHISVLVGDETPSRQSVLYGLLQEIGIGCINQAAGRSELTRALGRYPLDAILLTGCNFQEAIQITAEIRASDEHAYTPVILIIDHVDGQSAQSARDAGVTDFLARPVTADSLIHVLTSVLAPHRPGQHSAQAKQLASAGVQ